MVIYRALYTEKFAYLVSLLEIKTNSKIVASSNHSILRIDSLFLTNT